MQQRPGVTFRDGRGAGPCRTVSGRSGGGNAVAGRIGNRARRNAGRAPLGSFLLVAVATAGNLAGSTINWAIGRYLSERRDARWFPVSNAALERAETRFNRFGLPVLLLAWVPIIGDPLTLIAGLLRVRIVPFLLIVGAGKAARYTVIALALAA